jgi:uncharacterized DUF497 family protein
MRFEWDRRKAQLNLRKHRVGFDEAATVFYDPLSVTFEDPDYSLDEERLITVGFSLHKRLLVISYLERGAVIRIISARKATAHERRKHEA